MCFFYGPQLGLRMKDILERVDTHMLTSDECLSASVFVLACVDMYTRFLNTWGLCWLCYSRKHMF